MAFDELRDELERCRPADDPIDNLVVLERVESTNRLARRIAGEYAEQDVSVPQFLLVADEQLGGRGRRGRSWASPAGGGVYATRVVHRRDDAQCARLPLQVSVGLATALGEILDRGACRLKWPNDLVTERGKLGGILIETMPSPHNGTVVALVGFGVNRGAEDGEELADGATSLWRELGREPPSLGRLTWKLVAAVEREIHGEEDDLVERYRELSVHRRGQSLSCRLDHETVEGTFRGFDDRGFLRLEQDGRVRTVAAGEILE